MRTLPILLLALSMLLGGCTQAFFQPHRMLVNTPDRFGLEYEPVEMRAADGTELYGWFFPTPGAARGSVLFLHGNGDNISTAFPAVAWLPRAGFNVLALDYRGYGRSGGSPSLAGLQLDIDAGFRALMARPDVDAQRIIVFGQSLGGALAIHYVAHSKYRDSVRMVIADSAFSDYRLITQEKFASLPITWPLQWLPRFTVDNSYSPQAAVAALSPIPLLLIHGEQDTLVPLHHSQRLYKLARDPKDLWVLQDSGHIQSMKDEAVRKRLLAFLERHSAARAAASPAATR
jgi:fermentation-respiration switch protein FrsA (DUF1100 family)